MSLFDGIGFRGVNAANTSSPLLGQLQTNAQSGAPPSGTASERLAERFGRSFSTGFNTSAATVFDQVSQGEFEDPELAMKIASMEAGIAELKRNAVANEGSLPPTDDLPAPSADGANIIGGGAGGTEDVVNVNNVIAEQSMELLDLRIQQSEQRLEKVHNSLGQRFTKASQMVSASEGTWDPATFVPKSEAEAEAFGQRMVIDVTEAAAYLEVVKTQLDKARRQSTIVPSPQNTIAVQKLEADFDRQQAYVDKLAEIIDRMSSGDLTEAGALAMSGTTLRGADELSIDEIADAVRESGGTEEDVMRIVGAAEMADEEAKTGHSTRLDSTVDAVTEWAVGEFHRQMARNDRRREANREARADRATEQRDIQEKHLESKSLQEQREAESRREMNMIVAQAQRDEQRAALDQASAEHRAFLNALQQGSAAAQNAQNAS